MKWDQGHRSRDVVDRRGRSGGGGGGAAGLIPLLLRFRYGWVAVLLLVVGGFVFGGKNFVLGLLGTDTGPARSGDYRGTAEEERLVSFVSFALDDIQATWETQLPASLGQEYRRAKLVIFTDRVQSACGSQSAAVGPFYCPGDEQVYIDLGFYDALSQRLGAPGDFAQAYVIGHEVGHHVQNLTGVSGRVHAAKRGQGEKDANALSVLQELQADCYAGVWAHSAKTRNLLEIGDVEEALRAAAAIGDDTLQKRAGGAVAPETFTHGSAAQRSEWFRRGFDSGDARQCDTFSGSL